MATPVFEKMELPDSEEEGQLSEGEQEAEEPAEEGASPAAAGAAATLAAAAGGTEEQAGSRPASRGTEASDETGSETDFTALHHEAAAAKAGKPAREGAAPPLKLTEAALAGSPWVDLEHPVTLYEGTKLALMAPVVLLKVSSGWHGWEACGMGRRLVGWHWTEGMLLSHACLATCDLHVFGAL